MKPQGTVITFYSYKGGTGRSMTLANVACLLSKRHANSSKRILMMDFDLEAPGLHNFFTTVSEKVNQERPGVLNYFASLNKRFIQNGGLYAKITHQGGRFLAKEAPMDDYIISDVMPNLDLMKAGQFDAAYSELVASFDWFRFYQQYGETIRMVREWLASRYHFILIDSRTGLTDTSGICTMILPEKIVAVFTPNRQSIDGLLKLVKQAVEYRRTSNDFRPLTIFPLPSRIDIDEPHRRQAWRNDYQQKFEKLFMELYGLDTCSLADYFDEVQIPHSKYYAYGEEIAVLVEKRSESLSLSRAYHNFFTPLVDLDSAWRISAQPRSLESAVKAQKLNPEKIKVFISYAREDYTIAKRLYDDLKKNGVAPWLDSEELLPGQNWRKEIARVIREIDFFLLLVSSHSVSRRGYIQKEQKMALDVLDEFPMDEIFMIPVRFDGAEPLDERLKDLHWADLSNYDEGLKQLLRVFQNHAK